MSRQTLSIIIPVFNEAGNLEWHYKTINEYFKKKNYQKEIIYVNDGSSDGSLEVIKKIATTDPSVHYISFPRNFGKEAATTAGLKKCRGSAAIMVDADGQHPVEVIDKFIENWLDGYKVVVGIRQTNEKEGLIKRYGSIMFTKLLNSLTNNSSVKGSTDFRLIDRQVVDKFNELTEHNRVTRGLIDWLGFKPAYVQFNAPARHSGKPSYSYRKLLKLALHGFVSNSTKPLQLSGILGMFVMSLSALAAVCLIIEKYLFRDPLRLYVSGTAILALFLSFLIGLVLICQWLLAIYIESIHNEAQNRPLYIIENED